MTADETGRIDLMARTMYGPHWADGPLTWIDNRREDARDSLAAADAWDAEHGIVRIDTRDEAWVEKIAAAIGRLDGSAPHWYHAEARAVLAALRGEG